MRYLYKDERDFLNEVRLKWSRVKNNGYICYRDNKTSKKLKRSRVLYQIYNNVKLNKNDIIHHKDKNKENDHINNLKLMSTEEHSSNHRYGKGTKLKKAQHNKLSEEMIELILKLSKEIKNYSKIGRMVGVSDNCVSRYIKNSLK